MRLCHILWILLERCTLFLGRISKHNGMYFRAFLTVSRSICIAACLYILLVIPTSLARAYDLCTCNQLTCDNAVNCSNGEVLDQCGCCMVCARGKGETCGAGRAWGVCAKGLQCVVSARPGDLVTGEDQGICQGI